MNILASRTYPAFRQSVIVAELLPPSLMGNYHLAAATPASPARGLGAKQRRSCTGERYRDNLVRLDLHGHRAHVRTSTATHGQPERVDGQVRRRIRPDDAMTGHPPRMPVQPCHSRHYSTFGEHSELPRAGPIPPHARGLSRRSFLIGGTGLVAGTLIGSDLLTGGAALASPLPRQAAAAARRRRRTR